jgi:hypothetical protein
MSLLRAVFFITSAFVVGACGNGVQKIACMKMGTTDPLVVDALMFRLDIYGSGVHCNGAGVSAGSGTPLMSHAYQRGQAIVALDVPPGPHALVLTTFSDVAGQQVLGRGCIVQTLSAGAEVCFDLTLAAAGPDQGGAVGDMASAGTCGVCPPGDDAGATAESCCHDVCTNVASSVGNCGGCAMSCSSNHVAPHCAAGSCDGACLTGYGDCNKDKRSDGCETALNGITNCGACGVMCDTKNSLGASCSGASCAYTGCKPGHVDCNKSAPDTSGCACATAGSTAEGTPGCCGTGCQTQHTNGIGQSFFDCAASATHDATEALAACVAKTGDPNLCTNFSCSSTTSVYCDSTCVKNCSPCNCWEYGTGSANAGHVNTACNCASPSDPAWN